MHYSSINDNRPSCLCCGGSNLSSSSGDQHYQRNGGKPRIRRRPRSSRCAISGSYQAHSLWTTLAFVSLLPTIMLRAQAFTVPQLWKAKPHTINTSHRLYPHRCNPPQQVNLQPHRDRKSSRVAAINSQELRFYSQVGSSSSSSSQQDSAGPWSIPEILATSMSNYILASTKMLSFAGHWNTESQQNGQQEQQHQHRHRQQAYMSSSSVASRTAVLSPPNSLLQSQHTFRASSSSSRNSRQKDGDEEKDHVNEVSVNGVNGASSPIQNSNGARDMSAARRYPPPKQGYGYSISLTEEEKALFSLLRQVHDETQMTTTLRVAGGWVRDKLLATPEFQIFHHYCNAGTRLTSKFKRATTQEQPSMGRQGTKLLAQDENGPVDIDIALDTMLGREFADYLNEYLQSHGRDTVSVGVVLKNPEKSKHLETATMKVGSFWIDFVNLRAEEYTHDSRIPDLMRIGTASEDAYRRDLTINSLFFNINTGEVEDWTGRGFSDLRRGIVATPLAPLTTLLDDPLRVLRSIRFAARLRFGMDEELVAAAKEDRVRLALAQKVSRERVGGEVDLMLRSPDPVGAMRLLINLNLVETVFPVASCLPPHEERRRLRSLFEHCLHLLSTTHDHIFDCKISPPQWCKKEQITTTHNVAELTLMEDEEARRLLWYAAFLKPIHDYSLLLKQNQVTMRSGKKANRSILSKLLVDELKRPVRDAEQVETIMKAADEMTQLIQNGCDLSATLIFLSDVRVAESNGVWKCTMRGRSIDSVTEDDPVWEHAMEFRLLCSDVMKKVGSLWRAALMLSLSEQLASLADYNDLEYTIEGDSMDESREEQRLGIIEQYDNFATALQQMGLIGIWGATPLVDGEEMKQVMPYIPRGPSFREVMDEQERWLTAHPGASKEPLIEHMKNVFSDYTKPPPLQEKGPKKKETTKDER